MEKNKKSKRKRGLNMKINKIYKIRAWVNHTPERGRDKGRVQIESYHEEIILNNLKSAKELFKTALSRVQCDGYYGYRTWTAELFEPHVFENGTLAYWPDNENYIEKQTRKVEVKP
jgi:hypothetical protein